MLASLVEERGRGVGLLRSRLGDVGVAVVLGGRDGVPVGEGDEQGLGPADVDVERVREPSGVPGAEARDVGERIGHEWILRPGLHAGDPDVPAEQYQRHAVRGLLAAVAQGRPGQTEHELVYLDAERSRNGEVPALVQDHEQRERGNTPENGGERLVHSVDSSRFIVMSVRVLLVGVFATECKEHASVGRQRDGHRLLGAGYTERASCGRAGPTVDSLDLVDRFELLGACVVP